MVLPVVIPIFGSRIYVLFFYIKENIFNLKFIELYLYIVGFKAYLVSSYF